MGGEAGFKRGVGHAAGIAGIAGSFETVDHDQFAARFAIGALRVDQNLDAGFGLITVGVDRPAVFALRAGPEVSGDGRQVGIAEEWLKGPQEIIFACGCVRTGYFRVCGIHRSFWSRLMGWSLL